MEGSESNDREPIDLARLAVHTFNEFRFGLAIQSLQQRGIQLWHRDIQSSSRLILAEVGNIPDELIRRFITESARIVEGPMPADYPYDEEHFRLSARVYQYCLEHFNEVAAEAKRTQTTIKVEDLVRAGYIQPGAAQA